MSVFKRTIIFGLCLVLVFLSLPHLIYEDMYSTVNQTKMIFNVVLASIVGLYNFFMIYKKATTIHVVIDSENIRKKIENKKGEDNYV